MIRLDTKTRSAFTAASDEDLMSYLQTIKALKGDAGQKMQLFLKAQIDYAEREVKRREQAADSQKQLTGSFNLLEELKGQHLPLSPFTTEILAMLLTRMDEIDKSYCGLNVNANDKGTFSLSFWHPSAAVAQRKSLDEACQVLLQRFAELPNPLQLPSPSVKAMAVAKEMNRLLTLGHLSGSYTSLHINTSYNEVEARFGNRRRRRDSYHMPDSSTAMQEAIKELRALMKPVTQ